MKLVETFPGVWLSPNDVKMFYVCRKYDDTQKLKYYVTMRVKVYSSSPGDDKYFYGDEFDTREEAIKSVEPIIQRLNAYRD